MDVSTSAFPVKLTNRQELFAQAVAAGKPFSNAYLDAYGGTVRGSEANGSRMMRLDKVQARIAQIQADNAATQRVSVDSVTRMLRAAFDLSMAEKQASAASQAAMGLAKLHGFLIDRSMVDAVVRKPSASPDAEDMMSAEQWMKEFGASSGEIDQTVN